MVLDPFCGCATTCIAAEQLRREWVGIDISGKAADLVQARMRDELGLFYKGTHRTDIPRRTDLGKLPKYNSQANRQKLYGEQAGNCAGATRTSRPGIWRWTTSYPVAKAARIILRICNYSAVHAIASKATEAWNTCTPNYSCNNSLKLGNSEKKDCTCYIGFSKN